MTTGFSTDADAGPEPASGAPSVAVRRLVRWAGHALLGGRGVGTAGLLWLALALLAVLAFVFGGLFAIVLLSALGFAVVGLVIAGRTSIPTHSLMVGSVVVGSCAAAYVWWELGVQIEAADALRPPPAAAGHGGAGLIVVALSIVTFTASAVVGFARRPH